MKAIIVYDSNYGNTKTIAEEISKPLGAMTILVKSFKASDLEGIDLLVLGSPIIGWQPTVSMQEFLKKLSPGTLKGVKATAFDTRVKLFIHGDAKDKMVASLKRSGAEIITSPEAFYVTGPQNSPYLLDGELEKAKGWAQKIAAL